MKINYWFITAMFFILTTTFLIGASTCKVTNWEWNTFSSKADCMVKTLDKMEDEGRIPDLDVIARVEEYCSRYDR